MYKLCTAHNVQKIAYNECNCTNRKIPDRNNNRNWLMVGKIFGRHQDPKNYQTHIIKCIF